MDLVVGSGPSGISVAKALLAKGRDVTLVDGGADLDADALARRDMLAKEQPAAWSAEDLARYKQPQFDGPQGVAQRYGSSHAQNRPDVTFAGDADWFGLRASHAVGGLSNLWGAAVLPNADSDIDDWPVTARDLAPHYKAVSEFMPVAGVEDRLGALFPAFPMVDAQALPQSPQAAEIATRLERRMDKLSRDGFVWGRARQAVKTDCKACALCLHGCPWSYVFSAAHALPDLRTHPNFTYRPGWRVRAMSEEGDRAVLLGEDGTRLTGERAFIGAGVLETARLVLASFPAFGSELVLKDSQHFFTPHLHAWSGATRPDRAAHHSLTEIFLELMDPGISNRLIHSQIYTWNEFYAREMTSKYGRLPGMSKIFEALARRLVVAQTFLHSDLSGQIALRLSDDGKLIPEHRPNPATGRAVSAARKRVSRALRRAGLYALGFRRPFGWARIELPCGW